MKECHYSTVEAKPCRDRLWVEAGGLTILISLHCFNGHLTHHLIYTELRQDMCLSQCLNGCIVSSQNANYSE